MCDRKCSSLKINRQMWCSKEMSQKMFLIKFEIRRMKNDDNLESLLLKKHLVCMLVQDKLEIICAGDLPLQVNYAVGRLVAVIVYCFS